MRLLHTASCWSGPASGLGGKLLPRGFASGAMTGGLFGSGHVALTIIYNDGRGCGVAGRGWSSGEG